MEPSSIPIELISYRGLLKSFEDIVKGNFMNNKRNEAQKDENEKKNGLSSIKNLFVYTILCVVNMIENSLFTLMSYYDNLVYTPMKRAFLPVVESMPRQIPIRKNKTMLTINSNIVTLSRTMLFIPIVWFLKYNYSVAACVTVVLHAFFSHFDGFVARVHGYLYPNQDDTLFNRFFIAFCNKIVNLLILLAMLQTINFENCAYFETFFYCTVVYVLIGYDLLTAVIRVQNFYEAALIKDKSKMANKATLEWKLKTKLESVGIAALCLASNRSYENPVINAWGIFGLTFLILAIKMAHKTLEGTILTQSDEKKMSNAKSADNLLNLINERQQVAAAAAAVAVSSTEQQETRRRMNRSVSLAPILENHESSSSTNENSLIGLLEKNSSQEFAEEKREEGTTTVVFSNDDDDDEDEIEEQRQNDNYSEKHPFQFVRQMSVPTIRTDNRVDKVYTIGCFDLFHHGHVRLIERMREVGKKVIIGVHDSRSIYKLKNRVPVDSTEKRMSNVKQYADEVFCIASTDPSNYMQCIVSLDKNQTATYIRGDDMPNFPAKDVVEKLMPVKLLPYTQGVSSTQLRKEKYSHIKADDMEYLENNNN